MSKELRALNARFIHNFVTNDVPSHDAILHEDFICINPGGRRVSRADYLKAWATGFDAERIPYYDYRDEVIDVFGTTALIRSTNKRVSMKDGVETVAMTMYTDIYVQEDGAWKCIQAQITPVAPANYPPDETIVKKYVKGEFGPRTAWYGFSPPKEIRHESSRRYRTRRPVSRRAKPVPKAHELLIKVKAPSLNRADLAVALRASPRHRRRLRHDRRSGMRGRGRVGRCRRQGFQAGRSRHEFRRRSFAEYAVTDAGRAHKIPANNMTYEQAACMAVAVQTMHNALVGAGRLKKANRC